MLCVDYWLSVWRLREASVWALGFVLTWLILAAITYIAAWLVVPDVDPDGTMDFVALVWKHRFVQIGALVAAYAGFIYYALTCIPEL